MDDETEQKTFACAEKSCDVTFTNKDQLGWHQKKHDMMLNLRLTNKNNESADQTPTPTRFIRNCEEVGLFQDLQHVNPFDETFKKAVDSAKNGGCLEVPDANNSSDTLHTPHILPHIEESQKKIYKQVISEDHPYDFTSNEVQTIIEAVQTKTIKQDIIKTIVNNKLRSKAKMNSFISCVPFKNLKGKKNKDIINLDSEDENEFDSNERKKQVREMNKAAQVRCRKRKQSLWRDMEAEIWNLRQDNKKLKLENFNLKRQLLHCMEKHGTIETTEIVSSMHNQKTQEITSQNNGKDKSVTPIIIQLIPSGTTSTIPFTSNQPFSLKPITQVQGNTESRTLRKIVPKNMH